MNARRLRLLPAVALVLSLCAGGAAQAAVVCKVARSAQSGGATLIRADILSPSGVLRGAEVLVGADGTIACVGKACAESDPRADVMDCPNAVLSPGFIDTHEHLDFGHVAPKPDTGVRFGHRHDWRKGLRGFQSQETFTADKTRDSLSWNELRHLMSGTTSLIGEAMAPGLVRNLDFLDGLEGLPTPRAVYAIFPLDDVAGTLRGGDCDYGPHAATEEATGVLHAYVAHVSEGVDAEARNEFACLSSRSFDTTPLPAGGGVSHDIVQSNLAIVHGVALTPAMLALVAQRHAGLIWSPRSNLSLYGATLDLRTARRLGITVALGTDWLPSGSVSMGREAACAADYSAQHLGGLLRPRDIWLMMTLNAAKVVHVDDVVGSIAPGLAADLILVDRTAADPYQAVIGARPKDMLMVMRGGKVLTGSAQIAGGGPGCEPLDVNGARHAVCIAGETGLTYQALSAEMAAKGSWPAFFDGAPPIEPPCVQGRPKA